MTNNLLALLIAEFSDLFTNINDQQQLYLWADDDSYAHKMQRFPAGLHGLLTHAHPVFVYFQLIDFSIGTNNDIINNSDSNFIILL